MRNQPRLELTCAGDFYSSGQRGRRTYAIFDWRIRNVSSDLQQFTTERRRERENAERIGFELVVVSRRTIAPYGPAKCAFRLSAANGDSKPRIGQTGQCRISVQNQCILRPFPVPACLQSVLWKRNRAFESNPLRQPVSLFLSRRRYARKVDLPGPSAKSRRTRSARLHHVGSAG